MPLYSHLYLLSACLEHLHTIVARKLVVGFARLLTEGRQPLSK